MTTTWRDDAACRDSGAWEGSIASGARHGMYGGLTPTERHAVHRGRRGTEVTPRRHPVTPEQVEASNPHPPKGKPHDQSTQ